MSSTPKPHGLVLKDSDYRDIRTIALSGGTWEQLQCLTNRPITEVVDYVRHQFPHLAARFEYNHREHRRRV